MSQEAKFQDIKEDIASMVDDTLKKNLDEKEYEQKEAQSLLNGIVEEVINYLHDNQKNLNLLLLEQCFKKVILIFIIVPLAYGILILMVQLPKNMKMTLYIVSFLFLELLLKKKLEKKIFFFSFFLCYLKKTSFNKICFNFFKKINHFI